VKSLPLAPRVVGYLILAQLFAFFCGWVISTALAMAGIGVFPSSWDSLAIARAQRQAIASLYADEEGTVRIVPSAELLEELQRAPQMRIAVFDTLKHALPGSDSVLVSVLTPVVGISPTHVHFALPDDDGFAPEGFMAPMNTRYGRLHVAVHGQKFLWKDLLDAWAFDIKVLAAYFGMAVVLSTATAWFAVRNGLLPLRDVAHEASLIDMDTLGNRLTSSVVPTEAMPLVRAINQALERLDIGTRRQRLFTANAAHELRTPVAVLAARLDAPREANFENHLRRDVQRISHIIQQLLADARADDQSLPLDEIVDVNESVRAMVDNAALLAIRDERDIEYRGPSKPIFVRGNKSAIEAIVANLIDNALNVEPTHGAIAVRVDENATIEVIDHGPGVAVEDRQSIFEPFWRKRETSSGAGLGLAIARELVHKQGGRIWVEATPGGGATFKVSFPLVVA
jgi:signal transduction histidine kinase